MLHSEGGEGRIVSVLEAARRDDEERDGDGKVLMSGVLGSAPLASLWWLISARLTLYADPDSTFLDLSEMPVLRRGWTRRSRVKVIQ